ncbi:hypothetical protein [Metallibacterium scheffleri]|uniref:hypothetical protein n=1 Tax=Metallibacterium scheffleri TaxID=993689 RepID=UPI003CCCDB73
MYADPALACQRMNCDDPRSPLQERSMPRLHGHHAARRAQGNRQQLRRRIALEAARLISEHGLRDYHRAKLRAAERLGIRDDQALPHNDEIESLCASINACFLATVKSRPCRRDVWRRARRCGFCNVSSASGWRGAGGYR